MNSWHIAHSIAGIHDLAFLPCGVPCENSAAQKDSTASGSGSAPFLLSVSCDATLALRPSTSATAAVQKSAVCVFEDLHKEDIFQVDATKDGKFVATASADNFVKLFRVDAENKKVKFVRNLSRFTLPARCVAFTPDEKHVVCAGDGDDGVRIVAVDEQEEDSTKTLEGVAYVRSVAVDPLGKLVAVVDRDGTLSVFNIETAKRTFTVKKACPKVSNDAVTRSQPAWWPDGSAVVCPGRFSEEMAAAVAYDRESGEEAWKLQGSVHKGDVSIVSVSRTGHHVLTAGSDERVAIWDAETKAPLVAMRTDGIVTGVDWHPSRSRDVALIDDNGKLCMWSDAAPLSKKERKQKRIQEELDDLQGLRWDDDEDEKVVDKKAPVGIDADAMSGGDTEGGDVTAEEDSGEDLGDFIDDGTTTAAAAATAAAPRRRAASAPRRHHQHPAAVTTVVSASVSLPSACVQGRTEGELRRFLAYTMEGCVVSRAAAHGDHRMVEVRYHDVATRKPRLPDIVDHDGYTMASIGAKGVALACSHAVAYHPLESWTNSGTWRHDVVGERVACIAAGRSHVAVATDRTLRVLGAAGGTQRLVTCLPGPCAGMCASRDGSVLAVVYHNGAPARIGERMQLFLAYQVLDMESGTILYQGSLPLASGEKLTWLGFSEMGERDAVCAAAPSLCFADSSGSVAMRMQHMGGCFVPILSRGDGRRWIVGVDATTREVAAVTLRGGVAQPDATTMPSMTLVPFAPPTLGEAPPASGAEPGPATMASMLFAELASLEAGQIDAEVTEGLLAGAAYAGNDASSLASGARRRTNTCVGELDRQLLKLLLTACREDTLARSLELGALLRSSKALEGAVQLSNQLRLGALSDRLMALYDRQAHVPETQTQTQTQNLTQNLALYDTPPSPPAGKVLGLAPRTTATPVPVKEAKDVDAASKRSMAAAMGLGPRTPGTALAGEKRKRAEGNLPPKNMFAKKKV